MNEEELRTYRPEDRPTVRMGRAIAEAERRRFHHRLGGSAETIAAIEAIEQEGKR